MYQNLSELKTSYKTLRKVKMMVLFVKSILSQVKVLQRRYEDLKDHKSE